MKVENGTPFAAEAVPITSHEGKPSLLVLVKGTFSVAADGSVRHADEQVPVSFGDEPFDEGGTSVKWESDVYPFKPKADILFVGKAHAPGGQPAPWVDVSLRVGAKNKALRIFGERKWICNGKKLTPLTTSPLPFVTMDLLPERAFGGFDPRTGGICQENPEGRGYFDQEIVEDTARTFLPNIEDPRGLIRHWKDHPRPAGFGVVGKGCHPRFGYLGTYDEKWERERSPAPPVDFRPDFFNTAQPDLQVPGYLKGDEEVELVNLTPEGRLRFRLPGVRPSVVVTRADIELLGWEAPQSAEDVALHLDTLCLLPEERRFFLVWRGLCPLQNLGALEIRELAVTA